MKFYSVVDIVLESSEEISELTIIPKVFHQIEQEFSPSLAASITKLEVNQWQIVLNKHKEAYHICRRVAECLMNDGIEAYFGIGIGTISTAKASDTRKMDGQAFILARESLEISLSNHMAYTKQIPTKHCKIYLKLAPELLQREENRLAEQLVNTFIQNNETLRSKITDKQRESIVLYEQYGSYNELILHHPEVKKGTISDKMNKSNYWMIQKNNQVIDTLLDSFQEK